MCRCRSSPSPLRGALQSDCVKEKAGSCAGGKPLRNKCFGRRELTTLFFCTGCWGLAKTPPRPLRGALQKVAGRGTFREPRGEGTNALGAENSPRCSSVRDAGDSPKPPRRSAALLKGVAGRGKFRGTARGASRRPWRPHDVCACRRAGGRTMRILPCVRGGQINTYPVSNTSYVLQRKSKILWRVTSIFFL